ncbi:4-alpha-glucanotransferase [Paracnuella aquatica]|uniref:4-alpha-glucanotransferase n=1 Tax=Paracnuella aquatica TaxID=2268757 RepID=UPI000DF00C4B|nr:4-alpha-glucanotransferase [Paracnuella aquatica]RPD51386.1 4-alpha-glucanotransferase [Paracnuella aquatica]
MRIDFYIRYRTHFGQNLFIEGNLPQLGDGVPEARMPMQFLNEDWWQASIEVDENEYRSVHYQYVFIDEHGQQVKDGEGERILSFKNFSGHVTVYDTWVFSGSPELSFYTAPFRNIFLPQGKTPKVKEPKTFTHLFRIKAPLLANGEVPCLLGSCDALANWNTEKPVLMARHGDWWEAKADLSEEAGPIAYKYGIYNHKEEAFVRFEEDSNRLFNADHLPGRQVVLQDGFIRIRANNWKGAGVAIPVFSLRSQNSMGIGEFTDIKLLADWASEVGLKIIQLLPINDTNATFTAKDSYPYAAISAFALHPVYINLSKVGGKKSAALVKDLGKTQKELNSLAAVDYEAVIKLKLDTLRQLYELDGGAFREEKEYETFFLNNSHWLMPYAAFSYLRDKWGTPDFSKWKSHQVFDQAEIEKLCLPKSKTFKAIAFWYFVQYHLHLQLLDAVQYTHKKGIAVKGDIPIGIYRYGVDAWTAPQLYNMDQQAGAPPDDFAVSGQNWGFPTYNWQRMQEDGFSWWRQRFQQMSYYFDAFRIDHILGFFRIWSIPTHAVEGLLGVFVPALPISVAEFGERGIWFDAERFCNPYITDWVLENIFGYHADAVRSQFLYRDDHGAYHMQEAYNTQQKVAAHFAQLPANSDNEAIKLGLFQLIANVLLLEHPSSGGQAFHFRISMDQTLSFQALDEHLKGRLHELYIDYFFRRQDAFWKEDAMKKLPALKAATNMLICGEDLGMVPHSVPQVMQQLGILSLEIQRMPKDITREFFHPKDAPYLSVITPSTHDMSTIRGWWEESREKTQHFYNSVLEAWGQAPYYCEPWVVRAILLQHLFSPAMWSIFQLQDLLGMSESLRRQDPHEERINNPADPNHYWNYRMHLTLEQLGKEKGYNNELRSYIHNSGRA